LSAYSDMILATTGLVGYWRLGDASGNATAAFGAVTGTNTAITYGAAGALTGDADTAYTLNGTTSRVDLGNPAALQMQTGSAEIWCKTSVSAGGQRGLIVKNGQYAIFAHGDLFALYDFATTWRDTAIEVDDGLWHHVVLVFETAAVNGTFIYVDGALALTTTTTHTDTGNALYFGDMFGLGSFWDGQLDEAAIYNTKLSEATIQEHYALGANGLPSGNRFNIFQLRPIGA
jgi:hypothetical protein